MYTEHTHPCIVVWITATAADGPEKGASVECAGTWERPVRLAANVLIRCIYCCRACLAGARRLGIRGAVHLRCSGGRRSPFPRRDVEGHPDGRRVRLPRRRLLRRVHAE